MTEPTWGAGVDPVPSASPEDVAEQSVAVAADEGAPAETLSDDAAEHDALEQAQDVAPSEVRTPAAPPLEAEPADVADQQVAVELDEDDYR